MASDETRLPVASSPQTGSDLKLRAMTEPLEGLVVLELSPWRPGPYAAQLLADMGARVTKVEPPGGDPMRAFPELFESLNADKDLVELDLKDDGDRGRALTLAQDADIVIEGFRPGTARRLGVSYDDVRAVNGDVVYCSISGFGQTGPLSTAPGHDLTFQAWAGALSPDGEPPVVGRLPIADLAAGMAAAMAICAAYVRRATTGAGAYIDLGITDVVATWTGAATPRFATLDRATRSMPGYGIFETSDGGRIALGVLGEDHFWDALNDELGLAYRGLGFHDRVARLDEVQGAIAERITRRERDELVASLLRRGVPVAPVLSRTEMLALDQLHQRGTVVNDGTAVQLPLAFDR